MKKVILLVVCLGTAGTAPSQQKLSLAEALALGTANSRTARISEAGAEGASARAAEVRAALLPSLKADGSYRRLSDIDPFRVQLPGMPQPVIISPVVLDTYATHVGLQQPIFTGFKLLSNARAAASLAAAAEADVRGDRADLMLAIVSAYWALYQAREIRHAVDENVARLESYVKDGESMLKAGMITKADLLKIQVQHSNARIAQIDAGDDAQLAQMNCCLVLGIPLETDLELTSQPGAEQREIPHLIDGMLPELRARALEARPDLQSTGARVEAARAFLTAARGNWWPQVFFGGNYYYSRPNPRLLPTRDAWLGTWDLGVTVTLDLWNWGATLRQVEQASANLRQQELLFEQMKEGAKLEVTRSHLQATQAGRKLDVARLAVEQAQEGLRITRDRYRQSAATPSDLLDAEVALLQAVIGRSAATIEKEVAEARLARAVGILAH
jgi:outer membrane protein TolC